MSSVLICDGENKRKSLIKFELRLQNVRYLNSLTCLNSFWSKFDYKSNTFAFRGKHIEAVLVCFLSSSYHVAIGRH